MASPCRMTSIDALGVLALLCACPIFSPLLTYVSVSGITWPTLFERAFSDPTRLLRDVLRRSAVTDTTCWTLGVFWGIICILYWLPGPSKQGVLTRTGHMPMYTDNGLAHMTIFTLLFLYGAYDGVFPLSILYDQLQPMVFSLNIVAMVFCLYLYIKGRTHPTTQDVTYSGRGFFYDYYAGIELYPRVLGFDVKKIVNCRFSMTFWMIFGVSAVAASLRMHIDLDYGLLMNALTTYIYLITFFMWEVGYMRSIDIIEDNAGFMETWGCLVFVPALYTNHVHFSVRRPTGYTLVEAGALATLNLFCVVMVYWINRQRQVFRETNGESMLWWPHKPIFLRVEYTVDNGEHMEEKESILLLNGFWGVVRHPQYIFELGIALTWGLLANPWTYGVQPLFYFFFLTILLVHRAGRDSQRCRKKYGAGYSTYVANVPYMIIPGVY